jgi:hypothetical protein
VIKRLHLLAMLANRLQKFARSSVRKSSAIKIICKIGRSFKSSAKVEKIVCKKIVCKNRLQKSSAKIISKNVKSSETVESNRRQVPLASSYIRKPVP